MKSKLYFCLGGAFVGAIIVSALLSLGSIDREVKSVTTTEQLAVMKPGQKVGGGLVDVEKNVRFYMRQELLIADYHDQTMMVITMRCGDTINGIAKRIGVVEENKYTGTFVQKFAKENKIADGPNQALETGLWYLVPKGFEQAFFDAPRSAKEFNK